jgi:protein involved in polysaccharide export with SLBB domain
LTPLRLAVVFAVLTLAGCAGLPAVPGVSEMGSGRPAPRYEDAAREPWVDEDYRYRILPGDELNLNFIVNPDLNTRVVVGPDGRGVFPMVSSVPVAGRTVEEASQILTSAYANVLRNPQVETLISTYGASQIYVGGEVRTPGAVPLRGQINVAQAIVSAGGFLETAKTGKVVVLRRRARDGHLLVREVDVKGLLKGEPKGDFQILPGDLIFVPRSAVAEANLFIRQYINGLIPFNFGFSYDLRSTFQ